MHLLLSIVVSTTILAGVLSVIKTIGLVLLIIVIVAAVLAACILFVPVRYRAEGDFDKRELKGQLTWLFRMMKLQGQISGDETSYALYLFGFRTKLLDKDFLEKWKHFSARRKARKQKKAAASKKKALQKQKNAYHKKHDQYKAQYQEIYGEAGACDSAVNEATGSFDETENREAVDERVKESCEENLFQQKERESVAHSTNASEKKDSVMGILKKILHVLQAFRDYQPLQLIWPDVSRLLHRARPRSMQGDLVFGFDDPARTGQVLGLIGNLYFIYQFDKLYISGDFDSEKAYISGDIAMKGHLQMIFSIVFIFRIIRKKQFRRFLKALKQ